MKAIERVNATESSERVQPNSRWRGVRNTL
jgi:hypothetical protein